MITLGEGGVMHSEERIMAVVSYIEQHLTEPITVDQLAYVACWSRHHFQRMFHATTGVTVFDYVLKRRLTSSAVDLLESSDTILTIALKYDFKSHENYIRTFKRMFHYTPSQFRKAKSTPVFRMVDPLRVDQLQSRIDFSELFTGFEEQESSSYWGLSYKGTEQEQIQALWHRMLSETNGAVSTPLYGIIEYPEQFNLDLSFTYRVVTSEKQGRFHEEFQIPGVTFALFEFRGPVVQLPQVYQFLYGFWLGKEKLENQFGFDIECYPTAISGLDQTTTVQIKIPVVSIA